MIIVIDNVFDDIIRKNIYETYHMNKQPRSIFWYDKKSMESNVEKLIDLCDKHITVGDYVGAEAWTHYGAKPNYHYDKDEGLYHKTGELRFPCCSIVYYSYISDSLVGGEFVTEDIKIKPKTNRAIFFSPGILHSVEEYVGERYSLIINPWLHKPVF